MLCSSENEEIGQSVRYHQHTYYLPDVVAFESVRGQYGTEYSNHKALLNTGCHYLQFGEPIHNIDIMLSKVKQIE